MFRAACGARLAASVEESSIRGAAPAAPATVIAVPPSPPRRVKKNVPRGPGTRQAVVLVDVERVAAARRGGGVVSIQGRGDAAAAGASDAATPRLHASERDGAAATPRRREHPTRRCHRQAWHTCGRARSELSRRVLETFPTAPVSPARMPRSFGVARGCPGFAWRTFPIFKASIVDGGRSSIDCRPQSDAGDSQSNPSSLTRWPELIRAHFRCPSRCSPW